MLIMCVLPINQPLFCGSGRSLRMAARATDKVNIVLAIRVEIGRIQLSDIRVLWINLGVTLGTGFVRVQAHFRTFLKVACGTLQSFVDGTF